MKDALISRNIVTSGQKVSLNVFHVKEPHAENGLSKCEEQECALGLLRHVGVLLIVFKDTQWCLWLVQDSQVHPILYPPGDGALTLTAATVVHEFLWWILLSTRCVPGLHSSLDNLQYYSDLCNGHSLCARNYPTSDSITNILKTPWPGNQSIRGVV